MMGKSAWVLFALFIFVIGCTSSKRSSSRQNSSSIDSCEGQEKPDRAFWELNESGEPIVVSSDGVRTCQWKCDSDYVEYREECHLKLQNCSMKSLDGQGDSIARGYQKFNVHSGKYGKCVFQLCEEGYTAYKGSSDDTAEVCYPSTRACSITATVKGVANTVLGTGVETYDDRTKGDYDGNCVISACIAGYDSTQGMAPPVSPL